MKEELEKTNTIIEETEARIKEESKKFIELSKKNQVEGEEEADNLDEED